MNAPDILKYGQQTALRAIDLFPEAQWETSGACGVWSVQDVVAHLASYEEVLVDILAGFVGSGPTPRLDKYISLADRFKDTEVQERRSQGREQVRSNGMAPPTRWMTCWCTCTMGTSASTVRRSRRFKIGCRGGGVPVEE
ncbi:MAG: maleylpyruvate isomerase N-terminal domain-containing protein [Ktedonobacterales bacterium]